MRPAVLLPFAVALCALCVLFFWTSRREVVEAIVASQSKRELASAPPELTPAERAPQQSHREQLEDPALATARAVDAVREGSVSTFGFHHGKPEDPVERGECVLELHLEDAESAEPLQGTIELWRLGAPANDNWSQGDQLQGVHSISAQGTPIVGLPAAEYRVVFQGGRADAEDAAAFFVVGARTLHTLRVQPPREVEVLLELYELDGTRIESVELRRGTRSSVNVEPPPPAWLVERTTEREYVDFRHGGGGSYLSSSHRSWKPRTAGPRGFSLGALLQSSRTYKLSHEFSVRVPGRGEINLCIDTFPRAGERLVGLFMNAEEAQRHVVFPGGRRGAAALEHEVHVESRPIVIDEHDSQRDWRNAVIALTVFRPPHAAWKREWTPSQGPLPDYWLDETDE